MSAVKVIVDSSRLSGGHYLDSGRLSPGAQLLVPHRKQGVGGPNGKRTGQMHCTGTAKPV